MVFKLNKTRTFEFLNTLIHLLNRLLCMTIFLQTISRLRGILETYFTCLPIRSIKECTHYAFPISKDHLLFIFCIQFFILLLQLQYHIQCFTYSLIIDFDCCFLCHSETKTHHLYLFNYFHISFNSLNRNFFKKLIQHNILIIIK